MKPTCPLCGNPPVFACGWHGDCPAYVGSHMCTVNGQKFVACVCGASAWGKDTHEAMANLGGTFKEPSDWRTR